MRPNRTCTRKSERRAELTKPTRYPNSVQNSDPNTQTWTHTTTLRRKRDPMDKLILFEFQSDWTFFLWACQSCSSLTPKRSLCPIHMLPCYACKVFHTNKDAIDTFWGEHFLLACSYQPRCNRRAIHNDSLSQTTCDTEKRTQRSWDWESNTTKEQKREDENSHQLIKRTFLARFLKNRFVCRRCTVVSY